MLTKKRTKSAIRKCSLVDADIPARIRKMTIRLFIPLGLICLSAFCSAADLKAEFQEKYNALSAAFAKGDTSPFEKALAPGYVLIVPKQPNKDRAEVLADFKRQMRMMRNSKWQRKVTKVVSSKMSTVVTVSSHFHGQFGPTDKPKTFENDAVSEDTWTKGAHGWLLSKSSLVKMSAKIDGKSVGKM